MSDIIIPRNNTLLKFLAQENTGYTYSKRFLSAGKDSKANLTIQVYNANPAKPVSILDVKAMQEFIHRHCLGTAEIKYDGTTLELLTVNFAQDIEMAENQYLELIQEEILHRPNGHKEHDNMSKPFLIEMSIKSKWGKIIT